jgi:phenylpropionate dioxygenase-like ring-hydroxylating dioxygenase large terminal subunit
MQSGRSLETLMTPADLRKLIPAIGLKEYWYPALKSGRVGNKPVPLKLLGEDLVFFRGADGEIAALANACPHRGGSLSDGDCHYKGTVACPYHGWVFDADGECIAVLSEGPESRIPGKVRARKYPTRTLRNLVFVWMGKGEPALIEEDVPPEFFDQAEDLMVFSTFGFWPVDWRVALENSLDAHVFYVHRNAALMLMEPIVQFGPVGNRTRTVNGRAAIGYMTEAPLVGQEFYPRLNAYWPKTNWRRYWLGIIALFKHYSTVKLWSQYPPFNDNEEWDMHTYIDGKRARSGGHHLPSMFRFDFGPHLLTRACVPIDEHTTRIVYYHSLRRKGAIRQALYTLYFHSIYRWALYNNFSMQDYRVMSKQRYDLPERLSATDAEVVAWRRLLLSARGMPREVRVDVEAEPSKHPEPAS